MKVVKVKILDEQNGVTRISCGGTETIAFLPGTNLGPFGHTIEVAKMLVAPLGSKIANKLRYHNSITQENSSLYGAKMDKALCRDTFGTLYRRGPYAALQDMEARFNERR